MTPSRRAGPARTPPPASGKRLWGDLKGSLNGAATSFATTIGGGALVFAPLGVEWVPYGIVASVIAAVSGGISSSLVSSLPVSISSPRASVCIVVAGFVAALHRSVPELAPAAVMALASLMVVAAGLVQMLAAAFRLGRLVRFVPFPVISGFTHGIALTLVVVYLPLLLGLAEVPRRALPRFDVLHAGAPLIGIVALAAIVACTKFRRTWPAAFVGLVAGVAASVAAARFLPGLDVGAALAPGSAPLVSSPFEQWAAVPRLMGDADAPRLLISFAVALACVASIDSMVGTMAVESGRTERSEPDRDLFAQGLGNAIAGCLGGSAIAYSMVQVQAAQAAGARTRIVGPLSSSGVGVLAIGGAVWLESVPLAVLAALMLFIAARLADAWGKALLRNVGAGGLRDDANLREGFVVYLLVALSIVLLDIVAALAVGLLASVTIFVRTMNESVIRSVRTGSGIQSRRMYSPATAEALHRAMEAVAVVELEGALFFGTADRLASTVDGLPGNVRFVLLDLGRVHALDTTAGTVVARANARLRAQGRTLVLCGWTNPLQVLTGSPPPAFRDRDRAVEWIEERLLAEGGFAATESSIAPSALGRFFDLDEGETASLLEHVRVSTHAAGAVLFREGEPGDELCFLLSGRLSIMRADHEQRDVRVVTYLPGNLFGDIAFVDRRPRSASAVCDTDCRVLTLSRDSLPQIAAVSPQAVVKIHATLARNIAERLRVSDAIARGDGKN